VVSPVRPGNIVHPDGQPQTNPIAEELAPERRVRLFGVPGFRGVPAFRGVVAAVVVTSVLVAAAFSTGAVPGPWSAQKTAHFSMSGLAFDYPASWHLETQSNPAHYETVFAFLGTGTASQVCPIGYIPGADSCADSYDLGPDLFVLRLSVQDGPPVRIDQVTDLLRADPAAVSLTIGGRPAAMQVQAGQLSVIWTVAGENADIAYVLQARIQGPDVSTIRAQIDAVVRTITFDEPLPAAPPTAPVIPVGSPPASV
jgi:hypothetical protein